MERTRVYSWSDPRGQDQAGQTMSGLAFMRSLLANDPGGTPMMATLGFQFVAVEAGYVAFECSLTEFLYNPIGLVHGGVAATLLDSAAGSAVHTMLPSGTGYATVDLSVHYLRPITSDLERVRATGTVINRGRRTALGAAEVRDGADRLLAHATSSCMLFAQ